MEDLTLEEFEQELQVLFGRLLRCFLYIVVAMVAVCIPVPWLGTSLVLLVASYLLLKVSGEVVALNPGAPIAIYLTFAFLLAFIFTFPACLREIYLYIKPALLKNELRLFKKTVLPLITVFYSGFVYGLFVISPIALKATVSISQYTIPTERIYAINEIAGIVLTASVLAAIILIIPIILNYLIRVEMIEKEYVAKNRYWLYVAIWAIIMIIDNEPTFIVESLVTVPFIFMTELALRWV